MAKLPSEFDLGQRPAPTPVLDVAPVNNTLASQAKDEFAKSIGNVGDAIYQIDQKLQTARKATDLSNALASATEQIGTKQIEYAKDQDFKTAPQRFKQDTQGILDGISQTLTDPKVKAAFTQQTQHFAVSKQLQVVASAAKQEADYNAAQLDYNTDVWANTAANGNQSDKASAVNQFKTSLNEMVHAGWITDVQAKVKQDLFQKKYFEAKATNDPISAYSELIDSAKDMNPAIVKSLVPAFKAMVPAAFVDNLKSSGQLGSLIQYIKGTPTSKIDTTETTPAPYQDQTDRALSSAEAAKSRTVGTIDARGIRNNNPGNIMKGDQWQGEVNGVDPKYATFSSPEAGVRAIGKTLLTYSDNYGLNTVSGIISRWAPASENDTATYIKTVSKTLGVSPDQALDIKNQSVMTGLTRAIIAHENGKDGSKITDAQIQSGVNSALNNAKLPPGLEQVDPNVQVINAANDTSTKSFSPFYDKLPADVRLRINTLALAQAKEDMAGQVDAMNQRLKDVSAEYLVNGNAKNPPSDSELMATYGQVRGPEAIDKLHRAQLYGQNILSMKTMPTSDIDAMIANSKPQAGHDFYQNNQNYVQMQEVARQINNARVADPVGYALQTNQYGFKPVDVTNPQAFLTELQSRTNSVGNMSRDYGVNPTVLSADELGAMKSFIKNAPTDTKKQYLKVLYQGMYSEDNPNMYLRTLAQIAPDQPTVAMAGLAAGRQYQTTNTSGAAVDVADLILAGHEIRTPNSKEDGSGKMGGKALIKLPPDDQLLQQWNSNVGKAFQGKPDVANAVWQTTNDIYAKLASDSLSDTSVVDNSLYKRAVALASGGVASVNSSDVVLPYNMDKSTFVDGLKARAIESYKKQPMAEIGSAAELANLPIVNGQHDGEYNFRYGTGYLTGKDGKLVTVDFKQPAPIAPNIVRPEAPATSVRRGSL